MHSCTEDDTMKIKMQRFGKPYEPRKEARNRRNALIGIAVSYTHLTLPTT